MTDDAEGASPRSADTPFRPQSVVVITGIMGSGKSTVAELLAARLPRAAHVRGDVFRRMIISGRAEMTPTAGREALAQLELRYRLAAMVADAYAAAGFTGVYQDIILGEHLAKLPAIIRARPLFLFVLAPRPDVALARAEGRAKTSGYGEWTVQALDRLLRESPRIGLWLDTSDQTPAETVDAIRRGAREAELR